jgi:predicted ATPase/DNA-binding winged helix-turn-helix (wHTH) protein
MTGERSAPAQETISFGPFELSSGERILRRDGLVLPLGGRALDILIYLVGRPGEVVTKKELIDHAWPDVVVEEGSVRVHIAAIRKALGDGQFGSRYITNIKGRGYCFVAPVSRSSAASRPVDDGSTSKKGPAFPPRLSRMIGREVAVDTISAQLVAGRFVTIVGAGGIGKTTVAVSIGRRLFEEFGDLVHFIDLGSLKDPLLVASATGVALGLPINERDPVPSLIAALRHRRMLLVFDSCEHVIETASVLAERIFNEAPQVHILATSREALNVEGEQVHRLAPLECPSEEAHLTAQAALAFPAVRLFMERATANEARLAFSDADAPVVAEICRKLDGIALAIELAAGRVGAYGIRKVATLIGQRFGLLWGGRRNALPRHRTLTATLDWSYDLLPELERATLRRLSVFAGIFTLEAARSVAAANDVDDALVVSAMIGLVTKSLVAADASDATTHFRLLDTTRAYASQKLVESGEADRIAYRHAVYYRELLNRVGAKTLGSDVKLDRTGSVTEASIETHDRRVIDEVRAALGWAYSDRGDPTLAVDLTAAAAPVWIHHLLMDECRERIEQAIALFDEKVRRDARRDLRLFSSLAVAHLESTGDASKIDEAWSHTAELAEELNDSEYRIRSLWGLWLGRHFKGDYQGALQIATRFATLPDGAVEAADRFVGERILGVTLHILGDQSRARIHIENMLQGYVAPPGRIHVLRYHFDQSVAARTFYTQVLWLLGFPDQARAVGDRVLEDAMVQGQDVSLLYALAFGVCPLMLELGDFDATEALISRMFRWSAAFRPMQVWGQCYAGVLGIRRADTARGLSLLRDGLSGFPKSNFQNRYVFFLGNLAMGALDAGDHHGALVTIDEALDQSESNDDRWYVAELMRIKGDLVLRQNEPEAAVSAEALFSSSLDWSRKQNARCWELRTAISFARLMKQQGRPNEARELLEPIYLRFTEGFATKDLVEARSLLTSLGVTFAAS